MDLPCHELFAAATLTQYERWLHILRGDADLIAKLTHRIAATEQSAVAALSRLRLGYGTWH